MVGSSTLVAALPTAAAADDELERSGARETARRGLEAFEQQRYAEALELFNRAESVVHAPTHLLYVARAHVALGQLVSARETYLKLTREELPAMAPVAFKDARKSAATELALLEPRIPKLTLEVGDVPGAQVVLDDAVLDRIDAIVPPGTDIGSLEAAYNPPAVTQANLRRRPTAERAAA